MNQERVILFCGHMRDEPFVFSEDDGCCKTTMSWFSILAPQIRSPSSGTAPSSSPLRTPRTLSPFAVLKLPTRTFFTAVDSYIFIFHDSINKILTFNSSGDWKLAPPMNCPRTSPHIIVLDGKLFVIGGLIHPIGVLKYPLPIDYCFMELFDPDIGIWEPLPNPPFMNQPSEMVTALLHDRKILVASYTGSVLYFYHIDYGVWTLSLSINLSKGNFLLSPDMVKSVGVGDMLYRVSFDHVDHPKHLVIQAFNLSLDQWFEGCLNVGSEIFGEYNEVLEDGYPCCGLIHLCDQKFCLLLQSSHTEDGNGNGNGNSDFDRRRSAYFKPRSASSSYLYSVVLEVSIILDKPRDLAGFMGLNIVVLSTEKYRLVSPLLIQDAMLVDITFHPSNMLALRCNESLLNEFGMARPSKAVCEELLQHHLVIAKRIWDGPTLLGGV
nr:uncharacterized protein LOC112031777 [Quercus suber]POF00484.1 hypothetical protein CFP56_55156 [Quercus suber]